MPTSPFHLHPQVIRPKRLAVGVVAALGILTVGIPSTPSLALQPEDLLQLLKETAQPNSSGDQVDPAPTSTNRTSSDRTSSDRTSSDRTTSDSQTVRTDRDPAQEETTAAGPKFTCQFLDGQYTVMYHPDSQPGQAYPWAVPSELGGGWTPERRCNEISRRLEFYRPDGLQELSTAVENSYNTICVTTQRDSRCRIVLTVPPDQNPQLVRDRVFQNLTVADSGQGTQPVNAFVGGEEDDAVLRQVGQVLNGLGIGNSSHRPSNPGNSGSGVPVIGFTNGINLRPFLDASDGGTGRMLRGGVRMP